ncbi:DsbA family oxidoreductase [Cognatishimia activa]|uniref:Protein-disulfide isomerase n=1 Tax=Cognatishimia activa TaxID=1715691 RepID=A0A0P1ITR2_9RHOB|nr:DsbA family oxidoreductase [Cognatishimia activa]CUJ25692.1 Protein-disulfide isomerase [Cognatishimia activa]CUK25324.1 Protein-disulfide isomerase [Cognatishimia activa]
MDPIKLDIMSDPICPWCYIGKTLLERALEQEGDHPFLIEWHPFQLNPDMPAGGMDRAEYLETKFGGQENAVKVYSQIVEHAEAANIKLDVGAIKRTPNTLDAHRLISWAKIEGKQNAIVDALFHAYFIDGRDIGDHEVLGDLADSVGMDAAVVQRLLKSDADVEEIKQRDATAREMGVNSVPTFIVGGRHAVPGAQQPELWRKVIAELREQQTSNA